MIIFARIEKILVDSFENGDLLAKELQQRYKNFCRKKNIDKHLEAVLNAVEAVDYFQYEKFDNPEKIRKVLQIVTAFHDNTYIEKSPNNEFDSGKYFMDTTEHYRFLRTATNSPTALYNSDRFVIAQIIAQTFDYSGQDLYSRIFNEIDKRLIHVGDE